MLVAEENPKLLKFLREELSLHIELAQSNIHNLLHYMASSQEIAKSSYIKSFKKIEIPKYISEEKLHQIEEPKVVINRVREVHDLNDIKIDNSPKGFIERVKSLFSTPDDAQNGSILATMLPLLIIIVIGIFVNFENNQIIDKIDKKDIQILSHKRNMRLVDISKNIFQSMGKNGEVTKAIISTKEVKIKGVVWGIEPLKNSLKNLYRSGEFTIKPLDNFMTEFTFISKI
jgi:hypothetical protein